VELRDDPWLSEVFGYPVLVAGRCGERREPPVPSFVYAKVDAADTDRVGALEDEGFRVVDVNVTLARRAAEPPPPAHGPVRVERAAPEHTGAVLEIAGGAFRYSRFHLDPEVPGELADRVKREWIRSYVEGRRGLELLVALEGDRPLGFLAVLEADGARVIDLVAVAPEAQGRGVGGALVGAFVARHAPHSSELRVGTQVANVPSLRLYARHGFEPAAAAYVLHRHVR
jgi:GNAT superfamily N-acetyltransferase